MLRIPCLLPSPGAGDKDFRVQIALASSPSCAPDCPCDKAKSQLPVCGVELHPSLRQVSTEALTGCQTLLWELEAMVNETEFCDSGDRESTKRTQSVQLEAGAPENKEAARG